MAFECISSLLLSLTVQLKSRKEKKHGKNAGKKKAKPKMTSSNGDENHTKSKSTEALAGKSSTLCPPALATY